MAKMQTKKSAAKKGSKKPKKHAASPAQGFLKSKQQLGEELTKRAQSLLDPDKRNLLEVGKITNQFKNDEELWRSMNYETFSAWADDTFGKGVKIAYRCRKIYENVSPYFSEEQILDLGQVKAFAYSRLPESERAKDEWKNYALHEDSTTFNKRVKDFLKGSPDHREGFCKWQREIPKSLKPVLDRVLEGYGNVLRSEDAGLKEDWQILEVIFVELEQEHQGDENWSHPEADAENTELPEEKAISDEVKEQLQAEAEAVSDEIADLEAMEEPDEETVKCVHCGFEGSAQFEPCNWQTGKLRRLDKAPLAMRKQLGTSFGYLCGSSYFQLLQELNPEPEPEDAECVTTVES